MHYLFMFVCENTHHSKCTAKTITKLLCLICWLWKCSHDFSANIERNRSYFRSIFFLVMKLNINKNERISMKFNGIRWCLTCFNKKKSNENRMEKFSLRKMLQTKNSQYLHQNQITRAMKWFAWKITWIFPSVF